MKIRRVKKTVATMGLIVVVTLVSFALGLAHETRVCRAFGYSLGCNTVFRPAQRASDDYPLRGWFARSLGSLRLHVLSWGSGQQISRRQPRQPIELTFAPARAAENSPPSARFGPLDLDLFSASPSNRFARSFFLRSPRGVVPEPVTRRWRGSCLGRTPRRGFRTRKNLEQFAARVESNCHGGNVMIVKKRAKAQRANQRGRIAFLGSGGATPRSPMIEEKAMMIFQPDILIELNSSPAIEDAFISIRKGAYARGAARRRGLFSRACGGQV